MREGESSLSSRRYLTGVVFVALLLWGPVDHLGAMRWIVRPAYLVAAPTATWILLGWIWSKWQPTKPAEIRLERLLAGATAGLLFIEAVRLAMSKQHLICTDVVQTRDGIECVGDYTTAAGPDFAKALMVALVGGMVYWFGVRRRKRAPGA